MTVLTPTIHRPETATVPVSEQTARGEEQHAAPDPHLAHHFETSKQQFEAAKLGMWLFLATEFLLFGGLFCLYAVLRHTRPEIFEYGARFLNVNLGFLNTVVLILSSLTMAWAVRCAQMDQQRRLMLCLLLTIAGGATFMTVKYFEYAHKFRENLKWGLAFYQEPESHRAAHEAAALAFAATPVVEPHGDAGKGRTLWMNTCRSCHEVDGRGMAGQGKDIRSSPFIAGKSDKELVAFIKLGRMPFDKLNTTGVQMPPRGGNPLLKDQDLLDIVAYVRTFKLPPDEGPATAATARAVGDVIVPAPEQEFFIPKSSVPDAPAGPPGLVPRWDQPPPAPDRTPPADPRRDPDRPHNTHLFFGVYYLMTGLHGVHVVIGMLAVTWLLIRSRLGHFSSGYFTPVDLVGLYWHVVDIIWIFLFPLLYLIH